MPTDCSLANVRSWSKAESKEDNTQETIRDQLRKSCTPEQREPLSHIFMRRNSRKISEHFERKKENSFMTEIKSRIREIKAKSMAQTRLASCDSSQ